ncbi:MAG TPA: glucosyl-3-phosphoglycerate synthase [Anaerolineales bacterium]
MDRRYSTKLFRKVLVPVIHGASPDAALKVARLVADGPHILVAGVVGIPEGESLSAAALPARELRQVLRKLAEAGGFRITGRIRVAHQPWDEILQIVRKEEPDLMVLDTAHLTRLNMSAGAVLRFPLCDLIVAAGKIPDRPGKVVCALRGGPHAELALRLGLAIGRTSNSRITALHLSPTNPSPLGDAAFKGVDRVLRNLPRVTRKYVQTDDAAKGILDASRSCDLLVLGATARPQEALISMGQVAETLLEQRSKGLLIVKSSRPFPSNMNTEAAGQTAISVLVDKWFAENTYHASEFADLASLLELKSKQELTISLALPALNEEATVGHVIEVLQEALVRRVPLVDEIILVDSNSVDRTREIAALQDVPVFVHQDVLPELGSRAGKGEALWKSLYLTHGDVVIWIDTDIANIHPRFVYGLLGPLITRPEIQFVKGFYRRPLKVDNKLQAGGGGRVTELTARPLLNLFFPELSGLIQPLSGEYGGRRIALEQMPFSSGYGVEIGLAIDIFEKFGLDAIAQVDLQERIHHNQPLESLSKMSFAIIQTVMRRIERRYDIKMLEDVNKTMKLIRYGQQRLMLDVDEIAELERPPMLEMPEYSAKFRGRV